MFKALIGWDSFYRERMNRVIITEACLLFYPIQIQSLLFFPVQAYKVTLTCPNKNNPKKVMPQIKSELGPAAPTDKKSLVQTFLCSCKPAVSLQYKCISINCGSYIRHMEHFCCGDTTQMGPTLPPVSFMRLIADISCTNCLSTLQMPCVNDYVLHIFWK